MPGKAKAESEDCPKIQALRARRKQKYGDAFFSGEPVLPAPVRGPYGEAKIRLKPDPRVYRHRKFALRGERKEAMEKILRKFMGRGGLAPCHSEWASPCFVVPKEAAGEWRLVVDYWGPNAQAQHDSYLGASSSWVKNDRKGRKITGFKRQQITIVLMDTSGPSRTSMAK